MKEAMFSIVVGLSMYSMGAQAKDAIAECTLVGADFASCAWKYEQLKQNSYRTKDVDVAYSVGAFRGFVMGVALSRLNSSFCPSQNFSDAQIYAVVAQYVRIHPEKWGEEPVDLVNMALGEAFPCQKPKK